MSSKAKLYTDIVRSLVPSKDIVYRSLTKCHPYMMKRVLHLHSLQEVIDSKLNNAMVYKKYQPLWPWIIITYKCNKILRKKGYISVYYQGVHVMFIDRCHGYTRGKPLRQGGYNFWSSFQLYKLLTPEPPN